MATPERDPFQQHWRKIIATARRDESFKKRLLGDPAAVLHESGLHAPAGVQLRVLEDTDRICHLILPAELLTGLGFLLVPGFFDAGLCASLRSAAGCAPSVASEVLVNGYSQLDKKARSVKEAEVPPETRNYVQDRVLAVLPLLEGHFQRKLTHCEPVEFFVYEEGDHFWPHSDQSTDPQDPEYAQRRQITLLIFLNSQAEHPALSEFGGGALNFYFEDRVTSQMRRYTLLPQAGLLVAFPSKILHEVTPVTHGVRYSIGTWFR